MNRRVLFSIIFVVFASVVVGLQDWHSQAADAGSVAGTVTAKGLSSGADLVVSLQAPGLAATPSASPVSVDQKGKTFVPHVLVVPTGTTIKFLNSDPFAHNVFSPEGRYDLGSWQQGQTKDHVFTKAGVYTQLCRIHPEMAAYIVVLDTPFYAQTDRAGAFEIRNVPPGRYTIVVWSEKLKELKQSLTVEAGKPTSVHLTLGS